MTCKVIDRPPAACHAGGMDAWLVWPGRVYPAAGLLVLGVGLVLMGIKAGVVGGRGRPNSWPAWALVYLFTFRGVVVGVCLVSAGLAWIDQVGWLLAASVCVGLGELLESSYYIGVLRWGQRRGSLPSLSP
jgi:hypothetical protein